MLSFATSHWHDQFPRGQNHWPVHQQPVLRNSRHVCVEQSSYSSLSAFFRLLSVCRPLYSHFPLRKCRLILSAPSNLSLPQAVTNATVRRRPRGNPVCI